MIDLSTLQIPPADVVPEPTTEEWERFVGYFKIRQAWYSRDSKSPWDEVAGITRSETYLFRRCRELEAEVARLRKVNEPVGWGGHLDE